MADIDWGEINVTIEKIKDPSVFNAVEECYKKADAAVMKTLGYRSEIFKMSKDRRCFNHEEEYKALEEKIKELEKEKGIGGYYLTEEFGDIASRMREIERESVPKYDEIHGREYDNTFDKFLRCQEKARMMLEETKRKLIEIGIHDENERKLESTITKDISFIEYVKDYMVKDYMQEKNKLLK